MRRRRLLLLLALASLVSSAAAKPSYSKWLVSAVDFRQKASPAQETWERGTIPFIGTHCYQYSYRSSPVFLRSRLAVDSDEDIAHDGFFGGQFTHWLRPPQGWVKQDLTKEVRAGDESKCTYYSGEGGEAWMFSYRQGKVCGVLVLTGIHIERPAFQKLVIQWTQRARLADPTASRNPKSPAKR